MLVTLPLVAPSLGWITLFAVLVTAVAAIGLYFIQHLDLGLVSIVEPWTTIAFAIFGFVLMTLREQRRVASVALLRAEAHGASRRRRANLLLALRDQLNSPLQILVLHAARLAQRSPADGAALLGSIERLMAISRRLAAIGDVGLAGAAPLSFDAGESLRRI
jgi:hypothetical protein